MVMANVPGKRISERKRPKHTGRGRENSFLRLPHFLLESSEFAELSPTGVKLLLDVAMLYRGANNGDLELVWSKLKIRGWRSQSTIHKAKDELLATGWLVCTRHGGKNRCSLYAITWEPIDECPGKDLELPAEKVASHLWKKQNRYSRKWSNPLQKMEQSAPFPLDSEQDCSKNWSSQGKQAA